MSKTIELGPLQIHFDPTYFLERNIDIFVRPGDKELVTPHKVYSILNGQNRGGNVLTARTGPHSEGATKVRLSILGRYGIETYQDRKNEFVDMVLKPLAVELNVTVPKI